MQNTLKELGNIAATFNNNFERAHIADGRLFNVSLTDRQRHDLIKAIDIGFEVERTRHPQGHILRANVYADVLVSAGRTEEARALLPEAARTKEAAGVYADNKAPVLATLCLN